MPRAKIRRTPPRFEIKPVRLGADVRDELINLLNLDPASTTQKRKIDKAVRAVEHYVGRYKGIAAIEGNLPGPASLLVELKQFEARGDFTASAFAALHPWLQQKFQVRGLEVCSTEQTPEQVRTLIADITQALQGEHRGRPAKRAFKDLVKQMRRIFRGFRRMDIDDDTLADLVPPDGLMNALEPTDDDEASLERAYQANIAWRGRLDTLIASGGQTTRHRQGAMHAKLCLATPMVTSPRTTRRLN